MAEAIAHAIEENQHLIAEAGTGTGKTFAYLVPAILSGKKVIISTGTKNLQDQLFNKDLPVIRKAMKTPFIAALLKGRSNYLCTYRLKNALTSTLGFSKEDAVALARIKSWSKRTQTGDTSEARGARCTPHRRSCMKRHSGNLSGAGQRLYRATPARIRSGQPWPRPHIIYHLPLSPPLSKPLSMPSAICVPALCHPDSHGESLPTAALIPPNSTKLHQTPPYFFV